MMNDEITGRVKRIYAAIGAAEESNPEALTAQVFETPAGRGVFQDFSGGMNSTQLTLLAQQVIFNVAHLKDHLNGWAKANGHPKNAVEGAISGSLPLRVIIDLANTDKHGDGRRDGGYSKLGPRLEEICRPLQLSSSAGKPSIVRVSLGSGKTEIVGTAKTVISGTVVDRDGKPIGTLHELISQAVSDWEALLRDFGLL